MQKFYNKSPCKSKKLNVQTDNTVLYNRIICNNHKNNIKKKQINKIAYVNVKGVNFFLE